MKVAVTGSTGLLGSALVPALEAHGHQVIRLVRSPQKVGPGCVLWDPKAQKPDLSELAGCDAVVHLAGENIAAARWNEKVKARIRDSRVQGTAALCRALASLEPRPRVLVNASAVGFYGDRGDELLDESSPPGKDFLADTCQEWEQSARPAQDAGIRVVFLRLGMIASAAGGAIKKMLTPFKMGAGGVLGSGEQYMSWIAIDDAAGLILFALQRESIAGAVNAVSPNPVTNREFTKTMGRVLRRPTIVPMPAFAVRMAFGEMGDALLLSSQRVLPKAAQAAGFAFEHPQLEPALRHLLGR